MSGEDDETKTLKVAPSAPPSEPLAPLARTPTPTPSASRSAPPRRASASASSVPSARAPAPSTAPSGESGASGASAASASRARDASTTNATLTALHGEEAARARAFGLVTALLCFGGIAAQFAYERDRTMRVLAFFAYLALGLSGLWVARRARSPEGYTRLVFRFFAIVALLAAIVIVQYFGVYSAVSAVVVLGSAFFALGEDRAFGIGVAIVIAVAHGVCATLVTAGVLPDLGIFPGGDVPPVARLATGGLVVCMYAAVIWQSRSNRRAMAEAIERSNRQARLARDREAQLDEVKENLDVALRAGAGGGRYTGVTCGHFSLEEIIGRGAMGEVYAARDAEGRRRAAVKLLNVRALDDPELSRRFAREIEIASRLRGPNVVEVLEVGTAQDGAPFFAMELLAGTDLGALLRRRTTLSLEEAQTLVDDVAAGLILAHSEGVVHRDLKPSNLFFADTASGRPVWKILDFGVSRIGSSRGTLTEGNVIGTPGYMSPEQAQGKTCEAAADLFSFGAVMYRALTGRRPFAGSDVPQMLFQVVYVQPPRPRDIVPTLSRDVEAVLALALAKRPRERFASAIEVSQAFRAAARGRLPEELRERAGRLLADAPWGQPVEDQRATRRESRPIRRS